MSNETNHHGAETMTEKQQVTWNVVVSHLHYNGELQGLLRSQDHDALWALADGFGRMPINELRELHIDRDWSHIRDSSDEALDRIATKINEIVKQGRN